MTTHIPYDKIKTHAERELSARGVEMEEKRTELEYQQRELRLLRAELGLNRKQFALEYGIPLRTVEDWEHGKRKMPEYVLRLLAYKVKLDAIHEQTETNDKKINIISEENGKKVVLINDIRFKSRRTISWGDIEKYLKEYIGNYYEIAESAEKIYIGTDFPDEFAHSDDTIRLQGANEKAKANMITAVGELIQIAANRSQYPDYDKKHKAKAKYGWYRYDTRFGIPVYDENGELVKYNVFSARMLVRCDADGKSYLYDFVRIKKETRSPLEQ